MNRKLITQENISNREEFGISVDKCRKVLGKKYDHYSDAEILQLRYVADLLVDVVFQKYEREFKS